MTVEQSGYVPQLEPEQKATWFAGFFEGTGTLSFSTYKTPKGVQIFPRVSYGQVDIDPLLMLQNVFGGSIAHTKNSFAWASIGNLARDIHLAIAPYAPSKKSITQITQNLDQNSKEDTLNNIKSLKGRTAVFPDMNEYVPLIQDNQFLAGLFDAQATFTHSAGTIHIDSSNYALLEALQYCYGGAIGNINQSTFRWVATQEATQHIAQDIQNASLLRYDLVNAILNETPAIEEGIPTHSARRLAYLMQDNSKMLFFTHRDRAGNLVAYPRITVRSTDIMFLQSLVSEFGGSYSFDQKRSRGVWSITGLHAAHLALSMRPWAHRLSDETNSAISVFSQWLNEPSTEERLNIAQQFRKQK